MSKIPVVAAIANYNMAVELERLLPQVLKQGYKAVFVLDDASTDNSQEVVERFGDKVTFVAGKANKGAGGNRNRIIKAMDYAAIIHFLDADLLRLNIQVQTSKRLFFLVAEAHAGACAECIIA